VEIGSFGVAPLGSGIDRFEVTSLDGGPGALPQELVQNPLDDGASYPSDL
jgi:hypothetical protein